MKNTVNFRELAIQNLCLERSLKLEQLFFLSNQEKASETNALIQSYKIHLKAFSSIEFYLDAFSYEYSWGINDKGVYIEFSFDVLSVLTAELKSPMQIIYETNCDEFGQDYIRIYAEIGRCLSFQSLKKYRGLM